MLEFGNKEFRNLQEQVGKNKDDIANLRGGVKIDRWLSQATDLTPFMVEDNVGKYYIIGENTLYTITKRANDGLIAINLGTYPSQGPQGPQGPTGVGEQGERGASIYGVSTELPSASNYRDGDFFLLANGNLYKKANGVWYLQTSIKGPQGVQGYPGDSVTVNPSDSATDHMTKLKVNGTTYDVEAVIPSADRELLDELKQNLEFHEDGSVEFGHDVYADGNLQAGYDVEVGRNLYIDDITKIQDPDGNQIAQGKLTAGDNITIENNVISASGGSSGNYFPIIDAPSSTTLTDEEITQFSKGCSLNGTFANYNNSFIGPSTLDSAVYDGMFLYSQFHSGTYDTSCGIGVYEILSGTKAISFKKLLDYNRRYPEFDIGDNSVRVYLKKLFNVNGKDFPSYPSSPTTPQYLTYGTNNALSWTSGATKLYKHSMNYNEFYITVITPRATAYSSVSPMTIDSTKVSTFVGNSNSNYQCIAMSSDGTGNITFVYISDTTNPAFVTQVVPLGSVTDTVTEL